MFCQPVDEGSPDGSTAVQPDSTHSGSCEGDYIINLQLEINYLTDKTTFAESMDEVGAKTDIDR